MTYEPQNELEALLLRSALDPAHSPHFYRELCRADVFIIRAPTADEPPLQEGRIRAGTSVVIPTIEHEGSRHTTFFSSVKRILECSKRETSYLMLRGSDFLEMTKGAYLVLNPGSDYGKFFVPAEVERLLDGSMWNVPSTVDVPPGTTIRLLEIAPAELPLDWMATLERYFRTNRRVKRAWVGHLSTEADGQSIHTVLVIEATGDFRKVVGEMNPIMSRTQVRALPLDIVQYEAHGGIGRQLAELVGPFYVRRFLGLS